MKTSILDRFAADAINAPAAITGGGGKCAKSSRKSRGGSRSKSRKSKRSKKSGSSRSGGSKSAPNVCAPPPPVCKLGPGRCD